jgi:microcin C transport system substrate-binding protein
MVAGFLRTAAAIGAVVAAFAVTAAAEPRHGMSTFGELKYGPDFRNFEYVNVNAPKGGTLRLRDLGSFDNLNPFITKGIRLRGTGAGALTLPFESLMTGAGDEPDSLYGLVAESVDVAPDKTWVTFKLRPEARWHDGSPITVDDVIFSFVTLKELGRPSFRLQYANIDRVEQTGPGEVTFTFAADVELRDLPALAATIPILSKRYYENVEFDKTTLEPPLGSGPYRIAEVVQGRTLVYERVEDYWGADLPVNRGRWNFGKIRFDFYRDRTIALEAFKAGEYDWREEFTSKNWATGYDFPARDDGRVILEKVPDESPASRQWFVPNLRLAKLQDRRVREAIGLVFDFEWTNTNLFYGIYDRSSSIFMNTNMAASSAPPDAAERALLEPFRDQLPEGIFDSVYQPSVTDGSGNIRDNLRRATALLRDAGWTIVDGELRDGAGTVMEIEILLGSPTFERVLAPFIQNLGKLGIDASLRIVDSAQYANRLQEFDFDIIIVAFGTAMTPGIGERSFWSAAVANSPGSINYAGIEDPVVDAMLDILATAETRDTLTTAARALDRVLTWNHYVIPQWYRSFHPLAYWDKFGRPEIKPKFGLGFLSTWWIDPAKAAALEAR